MKQPTRILLAVVALYALLNYSWVHAATVAAFSDTCDQRLLKASHASTTQLYGSLTSTPIVRCVTQPVLGKTVNYGTTSFGPGLNPVILIGLKGANVDVLAHELGHAELFERVGFFRREFRIPVWLDEGLAMQLDHRKEYDQQALARLQSRSDLKAPTLHSIASSAFFVPGDQGKYHYAYSKCVVATWLEGNNNWLVELRQLDSDIAESFRDAAQHCNAAVTHL